MKYAWIGAGAGRFVGIEWFGVIVYAVEYVCHGDGC